MSEINTVEHGITALFHDVKVERPCHFGKTVTEHNSILGKCKQITSLNPLC